MRKFVNFFVIPIFVFILSVWFTFGYSNISHSLPYKEGYVKVQFKLDDSVMTKEEAKLAIDTMFDCDYILISKDLSGTKYAGYTKVFSCVIVVDETLKLRDYVTTLTHELIHITHYTRNERYVSFMTFKTLYESENDYFKNIALYYAWLQFEAGFPYEYDCTGYIKEYFYAVDKK